MILTIFIRTSTEYHFFNQCNGLLHNFQSSKKIRPVYKYPLALPRYLCYSRSMKLFNILTLPAMAIAVCMGGTAAPQTAPTPTAQTATPTREQAQQEACDIIITICQRMEAVNDKESADKLAAMIEQEIVQAKSLLEAHNIRMEDIAPMLEQKGFSETRLDNAEMHLYENQAYGSLALAELLGIPISEVVELPPAPPELIAELEDIFTATVAELGLELKGGPGTTCETAWKMPATADAVPLQHRIIRALPAEISHETQSLVQGDKGMVYDMHTLIIGTADTVYTAELWFDITDYWNTEMKGAEAETE